MTQSSVHNTTPIYKSKQKMISDNISITLKHLHFNTDDISHVYYKTYNRCVQTKDLNTSNHTLSYTSTIAFRKKTIQI